MIFKSAKTLVEDAKLLVQSAGGGQEKLATSAQAISSTIESLVDSVKLGATSLGADDADTQVIAICICYLNTKLKTVLRLAL